MTAGGLWKDPSVPKQGWTCDDVTDLKDGDHYATCEMCLEAKIRWGHHMFHPRYGNLVVGHVCAGHMEGSLSRAEARERKFKNLIEAQERFVASPRWKKNAKGNWQIKSGDFRVVIFYRRDRRWGVVVTDTTKRGPYGPQGVFSGGGFRCPFEARPYAFAFMIEQEAKRSGVPGTAVYPGGALAHFAKFQALEEAPR